MNGRKKMRMMNVLANVETNVNMNKSIERNTQLNMKMITNMNVKMKPNTMLKTRIRCYRFSRDPRDFDSVAAAGEDRQNVRLQ
jgi:hypothetical protein